MPATWITKIPLFLRTRNYDVRTRYCVRQLSRVIVFLHDGRHVRTWYLLCTYINVVYMYVHYCYCVCTLLLPCTYMIVFAYVHDCYRVRTRLLLCTYISANMYVHEFYHVRTHCYHVPTRLLLCTYMTVIVYVHKRCIRACLFSILHDYYCVGLRAWLLLCKYLSFLIDTIVVVYA